MKSLRRTVLVHSVNDLDLGPANLTFICKGNRNERERSNIVLDHIFWG